MKDPIVEEIRKYRMEHTRKFGGDLKAICEDLRAYQAALGIKVVRLTPQQPKRKTVRAKSRPKR